MQFIVHTEHTELKSFSTLEEKFCIKNWFVLNYCVTIKPTERFN